jgi:hypothetical protein
MVAVNSIKSRLAGIMELHAQPQQQQIGKINLSEKM